MENVVSEESSHFAAILLRGGKQDFPPGTEQHNRHETYAAFDLWKFTEDFGEIMATPGDRLVVGASREEVEQAIDAKYVNGHGLGMLLEGEHYVTMEQEASRGWSSRRRYHAQLMNGWRVMDRPVVTREDWQTEEQLETLSMEYGGLWIDAESYRCLGGESGAKSKGFVTRDRIGSNRWNSDWVCVHFNPRNFQNKAWRAEKAKIEELLKGKYPEGLLDVIGHSFSPANWPHRRGFPDCLTWDGTNNIHKLLELIAFTKKFAPRRPFWRKHTHYHESGGGMSFKSAVDKLLIYTYGVVEQAKKLLAAKETYSHDRRTARDNLEFTKWLQAEAKAMKLKMPERPVVPPRPVNPLAINRKKQKGLNVVDMPAAVVFPIRPAPTLKPVGGETHAIQV